MSVRKLLFDVSFPLLGEAGTWMCSASATFLRLIALRMPPPPVSLSTPRLLCPLTADDAVDVLGVRMLESGIFAIASYLATRARRGAHTQWGVFRVQSPALMTRLFRSQRPRVCMDFYMLGSYLLRAAAANTILAANSRVASPLYVRTVELCFDTATTANLR